MTDEAFRLLKEGENVGFRCPDCGKDFGQNKEWFEDHLKAHQWDRKAEKPTLIITQYKRNADLKSIQDAIKSNRLRVWMDFDGGIRIHSMKTHIPLSEVKALTITVVSGDEIARVTKTDGEKQELDSAELCGNWRCQGFYDGTYDVDMEKIEDWTKRKDSYDWKGEV